MSVESRTPEPGSNAGREGADEQHQQTEEEKMLDEIAKQKEMIDAMSGDDTFGEMMRRARWASSTSERTETSMKFAKRGVSWAQREVGRSLVIGGEGCEEQEKAGLEWLNKAVAQNYPPATLELSGLHRIGLKSLGRKSQEKANKLLMKAANLGYAEANSELAQYCLLAEDGFEKNNEEAYFRASVAFALDGANAQAAKILGVLHFNEDVAESSPYLACYYANMRQIKISRKARVASILTKSRDLGYDDGIRLLNKLDSFGQGRCANCKKRAQAGERSKQCSKCKAQWYCSKECQVEAWRAGHKKDCKRAAILKFEDYLCAE
ncbi:hypothetical protein THAOC_06089 [Thalassiosira oceanica]|uniref:MYND-type domain-containing protein n=1 Tax=Thalassiosira oceanica TaxID=159749 RepID=K0TFL8_THAOC|nr:hypothetical protein THAOC_06089 [Thalassiosira oceanica]|eukprot:EJK72386.1 hypothetical protein THAOC_06089 [Thalassiosira oceanica]